MTGADDRHRDWPSRQRIRAGAVLVEKRDGKDVENSHLSPGRFEILSPEWSGMVWIGPEWHGRVDGRGVDPPSSGALRRTGG